MAQEMGTLPLEYSQAMRSVRAAKNILWVLLAVALAVQIAGFCAVAFGGVLDGVQKTCPAATQPGGEGASPTAEAPKKTDWWSCTLRWALPASQFLAMATALLLALTLLLAVNVALAGKLGGLPSLLSAFFWSLVLVAILIPWQNTLPRGPFAGATFSLSDLCDATRSIRASWGATEVTLWKQILYYVRFLAYPAVAVLLWLVVSLKLCSGCRKMVVAAASPLGPPR